jgi:hypothetical protein
MEKQIIANIAEFLGRASIQGKEVQAWQDCINWLRGQMAEIETKEAKVQDQPGPDGIKKSKK